MTKIHKHREVEGIWQFEKEIPVGNDLGKQVNDVFGFLHEDDTVTLRLLTLHPGQWKSDDDFYKLAARWEGDTLYYLPPFGSWSELATFENDHFINIGNGKKRIFRKIGSDEVVEWNRNILKANRERHDYRIKPVGESEK